MIGSLRGALLERTPRKDHGAEVLVEVGGVGYRVVVPSSAFGVLGEPGGEVRLHVHTHVREDAIVLYGFPTLDERACFEALIGAHGVGPGVALAMLSVHAPSALRRAVATEDVAALTLVPGIGPKTATRLLVELRSRLGPDEPVGPAAVGTVGSARGSVGQEVREALAGLGYGPEEIRHAVAGLPDDGEVGALLRQALRALAVVR